MNFSQLSYFETLAHELSFTRASQKLHITQQSLSSSIAKLEQELGCQLVVRHVPLELTYAGEVLLRYAASFREEYAVMQQEFCDISQNQVGVLRIGITYTRGRNILPDIIQTFQRQYPAIRIDLVEDLNDALRHKLVDGEVDIAIASFPETIPGIAVREFYQDEAVMLVSRELFEGLYGDEAPDRSRRLIDGNFAAIENCPLVLNSVDDISGHIERGLLKRAGLVRPRRRDLEQHRDAARALRARHRRLLLPRDPRARRLEQGGVRFASALQARRGRALPHLLRIPGAHVSVEHHRRLHGHCKAGHRAVKARSTPRRAPRCLPRAARGPRSRCRSSRHSPKAPHGWPARPEANSAP